MSTGLVALLPMCILLTVERGRVCAKGFLWLLGDVVGLGEGFCWWHGTV